MADITSANVSLDRYSLAEDVCELKAQVASLVMQLANQQCRIEAIERQSDTTMYIRRYPSSGNKE